MRTKLMFINIYDTNPYVNLAFEEYLLNNASKDEYILFLWQNRNTVVIGRNQNAFKECKIEELERAGGYLARRSTGGGAVYHDSGNLNFTFISLKDNYSIDKQLAVILEAVKAYGINAEKTGRNDISVNKRKFSGNAFLNRDNKRLHHGTILVNTDITRLSKYLNVSDNKLKANGVDSIKSRVVNLAELNEAITVDGMRDKLRTSFEHIYGGAAVHMDIENIDKAELNCLISKYQSDDWLFGKNMRVDYELSGKFFRGEITIQFMVNGKYIQSIEVYTDSLDEGLADKLKNLFNGVPFGKDNLLLKLKTSNIGEAADDLYSLIAKM